MGHQRTAHQLPSCSAHGDLQEHSAAISFEQIGMVLVQATAESQLAAIQELVAACKKRKPCPDFGTFRSYYDARRDAAKRKATQGGQRDGRTTEAEIEIDLEGLFSILMSPNSLHLWEEITPTSMHQGFGDVVADIGLSRWTPKQAPS